MDKCKTYDGIRKITNCIVSYFPETTSFWEIIQLWLSFKSILGLIFFLSFLVCRY